MSFLALSTLQTLGLMALTATTIILLYFLKVRHRRIVVASSVLWKRILDARSPDSLWERLRHILSICLAVAIGWAIIVAIARPEVRALGGGTRRTTIILDSSATMLAKTRDGASRWQHAVNTAESILDASMEVRVADTSGQIDSAFTGDRDELRRLIAGMHPATGAVDFPKLDEGSTTYFISDGVSQLNVPKSVQQLSVFEPAANAAITAFEIRPVPAHPDHYEAYLEIQNFGKSAATIQVAITSTGTHRLSTSASLAPAEQFKQIVDLSEFEGGAVRAAVQTSGDAFTLDDSAFGYLPVKKKTRTLLVTAGNSRLETMLKLDPFVELKVATPGQFAAMNNTEANVDAFVFDRFAPATAPIRPALIIGAPDAPWLRPAQGLLQKPAVDSVRDDHPAMKFVSLNDVSVTRAVKIEPGDLNILASAADGPLIVASNETAPTPWVLLTFDLQHSDFALHSGFPLFVDNVLAWFSREPSVIYARPGVVELPFADARIQDADGRSVPSYQHLGHTIFETESPGLFAAARGTARQMVAVNLANPQFSDINHTTPSAAGNVGVKSWLRHELWFYLLAGVIALLMLEWFTYHRRITL